MHCTVQLLMHVNIAAAAAAAAADADADDAAFAIAYSNKAVRELARHTAQRMSYQSAKINYQRWRVSDFTALAGVRLHSARVL